MSGPTGQAPAASGSLRQISFPAFLFALYKRDATGELHVRHGTGTDVVYLRDGFPVGVRNDRVTVDVLGQILFELGYITQDQQSRSLSMMASAGVRHGEILVKMGLLTPETLLHGLRVQLRRKLNRLFYVTEGGFDWYFVEHGKSAEVHCHPCQVILLGMKSAWGLDRLSPLDERLAGKRVALPGGFGPYEPLYEFDEDEQRAVRLLQEGYWDLLPFTERSRLGPVGARALLHALEVTEVLAIREASAVPDGSLRKLPEKEIGSGRAPLRVAPPAPAAAAPGGASHSRGVPVVGPRTPLPAGGPPSRAVTAVGGGVTGGGAPARAAAAVPVAPPPGSPAELRARIRKKLASIADADHFAVLEVDKSATTARVQDAYRALSKVYDPSHLPPEMADVQAAAYEIYERLVLANSILGDPRELAAYRELLQTGGPKDSLSARKLLVAEQAFNKGHEALKSGAVGLAEKEFAEARRLNPDEPEYRAAEAWARYVAAGGAAGAPRVLAEEVVDVITETLKQRPESDRLHYWMGELLEADGNHRAAVVHYRRAVEINPERADAKRKAARFDPRRAGPGDGDRGGQGGGGLLRGLFKGKK